MKNSLLAVMALCGIEPSISEVKVPSISKKAIFFIWDSPFPSYFKRLHCIVFLGNSQRKYEKSVNSDTISMKNMVKYV